MATKKSLEAAAATSGMFTAAKEPKKPTPPTKREGYTVEIGKDKPKKETRQQAPEPRRETATFSVKIDTEILKKWRYYASMDGYGDKGKLTEAALTEYMNRHKLTPEQQAKLDALMEI